MKERRIPVTVVIVDSGPLMSLAAAERLELLDRFERRVRITDIVRGECLRHLGKAGGPALREWFDSLPDYAEVLPTPFLPLWEEAVSQEDGGDETHPSKGIGDASVTWLLQRLGSIGPTEEIMLVLSEDAPLGTELSRSGTRKSTCFRRGLSFRFSPTLVRDPQSQQ